VHPSYPEKVYDLQVEEHHNFAVGAGVFVHNSIDSMQILEYQGIETKRVSTDLKTEPYRGLRDMFNEGRLEIPICYPSDGEPLLLKELYGLNKQATGKIDHMAGASKDMTDALACAVQAAVQLGGEEDGGLSYPGDTEFNNEPAADLADALPIGFTGPYGAVDGGFGYEVLRDHVSLDAWEDQIFGG
jgi:hypothetical protein